MKEEAREELFKDFHYLMNELKGTKYQIFVDMDGVLTNWEHQTKSLTGKTSEELQKEGGDPKMWGAIGEHGEDFWAKMPWTDDGKKLWNYLKKFPQVSILSAPARSIPTSKTGKEKWIKRELGSDAKFILCRAVEKQNHANTNSILIDDMEKNVLQFKAKGGLAILHKNSEDTIRQLKALGIN